MLSLKYAYNMPIDISKLPVLLSTVTCKYWRKCTKGTKFTGIRMIGTLDSNLVLRIVVN